LPSPSDNTNDISESKQEAFEQSVDKKEI